MALSAKAQDKTLVLEWEQHWPTYGVGGTCNFGTHNFFVGDVDDDGVVELITGGLTYDRPDYRDDELQAPLKIWNWDGANFTLETYHNWAGVLGAIYAADLNGDTKLEIITGGIVADGTDVYDAVRIWSWDNAEFVLRAECRGISACSIFAGDVDEDGVIEVLASGIGMERVSFQNQTLAQLYILQWDGDQLSLEKHHEWYTEGDASANSVYAHDLDEDGVLEIITGGYDHGLTNSSGQLRIWHWDGQELRMEADEEWRMVEGVYGVTVAGAPMGNTVAENVKVEDVDGDETAEIVTGGFTYDGQKMNAQLRIWNWDGSVLALEKSNEFFIRDITEVKAVALKDVDGDGLMDIVASGGTAVYGGFEAGTTPEAAWLRIWLWDSESLKLNYQEDWTIGEGVFAWNVGTGDIDNDGTVEIVTVGCMYVSALCDPDLRIWSLQPTATPDSSAYYTIGATITAALIVATVSGYLFVKKKRNEENKKTIRRT